MGRGAAPLLTGCLCGTPRGVTPPPAPPEPSAGRWVGAGRSSMAVRLASSSAFLATCARVWGGGTVCERVETENVCVHRTRTHSHPPHAVLACVPRLWLCHPHRRQTCGSGLASADHRVPRPRLPAPPSRPELDQARHIPPPTRRSQRLGQDARVPRQGRLRRWRLSLSHGARVLVGDRPAALPPREPECEGVRV